MPLFRSPSRPARARLGLTNLETRDTPATVIYSSGVLTISNLRGATTTTPFVTITETAPGVVQVQDAVTEGSYKVGNGIRVNGTNFGDTITLNLLAGGLLPGPVRIYAANGNDTVNINNNAGGAGRIGGLLLIDMSNGNDSVTIGTGAQVKVSGQVEFAGGAGNDTVTVGEFVSGSYLYAHRVNNLTLGAGGSTTTVNGYLDIDNINDFGVPNVFTLDATAQVAGSFEYTGGSGSDNVTINGFIGNVPGQFAVVSTFEGNSTMAFGPVAQIGAAGALTNFTFNGNSNANFGTDSISIAAGAVFANNLTVNMNEGDNDYNLVNLFTVGGNLTINGGSANEDFGDVNATVNGNGVFNLGSGNDTITLPTTASFANLTVNAGDGDDEVTLDGDAGATAVFNLGAGADFFFAVAPGTSTYGAATIDFGVDLDIDTVFIDDTNNGLASKTTVLNQTVMPLDVYTIV